MSRVAGAFYACASAKAKAFTPPRTPDGQPNLQGVWEAPMAGGLNNIEGRTPQARAATTLVVDPPEGTIPYHPWAREQKTENADEVHRPVLPLHADHGTAHHGEPARPADPPVSRPRDHRQRIGRAFVSYRLSRRTSHLPPDIKQWRGDSRGHWNGNTLEIETTNLAGLGWFSQGGDFFSDALKMTERLDTRRRRHDSLHQHHRRSQGLDAAMDARVCARTRRRKGLRGDGRGVLGERGGHAGAPRGRDEVVSGSSIPEVGDDLRHRSRIGPALCAGLAALTWLGASCSRPRPRRLRRCVRPLG